MSKRKQYPSQERLRELFDYDPEGFLVWRRRGDAPSNVSERDGGVKAGSLSVDGHGFVRQNVMINYKSYKEKVLIWIWHNGDPGEMYVKPINRIELDCRIENLTLSRNPYSHKPGKFGGNSATGYKGVYKTKAGPSYKAEIQFDGNKMSLGHYMSPIEAAISFDNKYEEIYGFRPNETTPDTVRALTRAESIQLSAMKKCKDQGRYMGVSRGNGRNRYGAYLRSKNVGNADTPEDAARLYNIAAFERYGENAVLNDVPKPLERPRFHKNVKTASGYVGVSKNGRRWAALYMSRHLGTFDTKEQAARAYNRAARDHYGEHAVLNDVPDPFGEDQDLPF